MTDYFRTLILYVFFYLEELFQICEGVCVSVYVYVWVYVFVCLKSVYDFIKLIKINVLRMIKWIFRVVNNKRTETKTETETTIKTFA